VVGCPPAEQSLFAVTVVMNTFTMVTEAAAECDHTTLVN
jgi:hypothetical protein